MTKKHFQKLAYELMSVRPAGGNEYEAWAEACCAVAKACAQSNPAFDRSRFLAACAADHYQPSMHGR